MQISAKRELLRHYRLVWMHCWRKRKAMTGPRRLAHEVDFLPASLALQERPVHPAPRVLQWLLSGFFAIGLFWACVGKIDVTATADGKIVPSGKTKLIQPNEVSVVKKIHVEDGQRVRAGDLLVELDMSITSADLERVRNDLLAARVDVARSQALLESIRDSTQPASVAALIPEVSAPRQQAAQRWLDGQYAEFSSALDYASAEIQQRSAELDAAKTVVDSIKNILPIARKLAEDYKTLLKDGGVARHSYLEKEQNRLDQERNLAAGQLRVKELMASLRAAEHKRTSIVAQHRRAMLDLHGEASQRTAALAQELSKAERRHQLKRLVAPVDGVVQQLAIHSQGGVVTEAQHLMVIVPDGQPVEVEAMIENKDIGFVHPGQTVEIKVETFNFTKYGVIPGVVTSISGDAIEKEQVGLLYSARIKLERNYLQVGGRDVPLSPGMAVRAEVITDKRRVISYFLSPLEQYAAESFSER